MHLHILGIGGTFYKHFQYSQRMLVLKVTGCDINCYPPVTTLLEEQGIPWIEGFDVNPQAMAADYVLVGNAIKRGLPVLEAILNKGKNYTSGPQWLAENLLTRYRVMAVSGTHGKTTTASMLPLYSIKLGLNQVFSSEVLPQILIQVPLFLLDHGLLLKQMNMTVLSLIKRPKLMHYRPEVQF